MHSMLSRAYLSVSWAFLLRTATLVSDRNSSLPIKAATRTSELVGN